MRILEAYTDGAASPNPGIGAWSFCIVEGKKPVFFISGSSPNATCNQMEMQAVICCLDYIKVKYHNELNDCLVYLHTDSQYVQRGITSWIKKWRKNNWKSQSGRVKNIELWKLILELSETVETHFQWVRGHSGNRWNDFVDKLCSEEIEKQKKMEINNG